eukprot:6175048-Pleurochrysis_carterae.AAC.3
MQSRHDEEAAAAIVAVHRADGTYTRRQALHEHACDGEGKGGEGEKELNNERCVEREGEDERDGRHGRVAANIIKATYYSVETGSLAALASTAKMSSNAGVVVDFEGEECLAPPNCLAGRATWHAMS